MKQYKLAPLYQWGLLIGSVLVFGFGAVRGLVSVAPVYSDIARERSRPLEMDTKQLVDGFQETSDIVMRAIGSTVSASQLSAPQPNGFAVNMYAKLSPREIKKLKQYITDIAAARDQYKTFLTKEFDQRISTLMVAATAALPTAERKPSSVSSLTPSHLYDTLYDTGAISEKELTDLRGVAGFLESRIGDYTPSRQPQQIAVEASKELSKLINFLDEEIRRQKEHPIAQEAPQNTPKAELPPKEELIREFIDKLNSCQDVVHAVLLSKWKLDETIQEARKMVNDKDEKIAVLAVARNLAVINSAMIFIICTIVAFLLLMIRDFMTATVGVASDLSRLMSRIEPGPPDA